MIDSLRRAETSLLLVLWVALGCAATPANLPVGSVLEPLPTRGSIVPDVPDFAARDLSRAILANQPEPASVAVERIRAFDEDRRSNEEDPSGVLPWALDALTATIPSEIERRAEQRALLERADLPKSLRTRIDAEVADDRLRLARRRIRDERIRRMGRAANAVIAPVGQSMSNTALLPYRLTQALLAIALAELEEDALPPAERQALAHWKTFIERNPSAPESMKLVERIQDAQKEWFRTQRDRNVRQSKRALEAGDGRLGAAYAERALRYAADDEEATALLVESRRIERSWELRRQRSLEAESLWDLESKRSRALALALLQPGGDVDGAASALLDAEPNGPVADEARFARANARGERGDEQAMWSGLEALADKGDAGSNMARHALALTSSLDENPYRGFELALSRRSSDRTRWLAFGPLKDGARDRDLPRPVEWLVELPTLAATLGGFPSRLLQFPFQSVERRAEAVMARRYLERFPEGAHTETVRSWLIGYEESRGNHVGALQLLEETGASTAELAELREKAAQQAVEASLGEERRDVRLRLLQQVASSFPDTEGARRAGEAFRTQLREFTPQRIRITKGFLLENPAVAGPSGLALKPSFLDDDPTNGELHPEGVMLLGGRAIELSFLARSGRKSDTPERRRQKISEERLTRVASQLEESTLHTLRTDRDARPEPDADRDLFLERARLGVTDQLDARPNAESAFVFEGMREKYGLVRSRESILPVEIVLQGNFRDFGLGAFPRIRMPRPTPDQHLYR